MLRKLFKYEFRYYAKRIPFAWLILSVMLLFARLSVELMNMLSESDKVVFLAFPAAFSIIGAYMAAIAVIAFPILLSAIRFYNNLVRDQGYLSFTLPVEPSSHLFCKIATPFFWTLLSAVVTVTLVLAAILIGSSPSPDSAVSSETGITADTVLLAVEWLLTALTSLVMTLVMIAFSISCGQLFRKHKLLGSILCFIGAQTIVNTISSVVTSILWFALIENFTEIISLTNIASIAINLIVITVLWLLSLKILRDKLNLE